VGPECAEEVIPLPAHRHRFEERAQDLGVGLETQRAQERGRQELPLAIDAHVEDVLLVELELDPGAAVRDDLGENEGPVGVGLEEDPGLRWSWLTMTRSVPLTMKVPF